MIRRPLSAALALTAAVACAAPSFAADCRISGADILGATSSQGITSAVKPTAVEPAATCNEMWPAVTISAPAQKRGGCRIDLFTGAVLNTGWKFKSYKFLGRPFTLVTAPGGSRLGMSLSVFVDAGESANISLKQIVLTGPRCADWADAITIGARPEN